MAAITDGLIALVDNDDDASVFARGDEKEAALPIQQHDDNNKRVVVLWRVHVGRLKAPPPPPPAAAATIDCNRNDDDDDDDDAILDLWFY